MQTVKTKQHPTLNPTKQRFVNLILILDFNLFNLVGH